jgi:hypothetical protein
MAVQERPYCGQPADDLLIADLLDAQPEYARHLADQPWRLSSPDAQSGRYAALATARGFTLSEQRYACLERPLAGGPVPVRQARSGETPSRLRPGFRLRELAGGSEAGSYAELHRAASGSPSMTARQAVCVEADQTNAAALRSYEAAGFRRTHTVRALGRTLPAPEQAGRR